MPILDLLTDDSDVDEINSSILTDELELDQLDGSIESEPAEQFVQNTEFTDLLGKFELETAINLSYLVTFTSFRGIHALNVHVKNTEAKYNIVLPKEYKRATASMVFLDTMEKSSQCMAKIAISSDMLPDTRKRVYNLLKQLPHFKPSTKVASFLKNEVPALPTPAADLAAHEDVEPAAEPVDVLPPAEPVDVLPPAEPVDVLPPAEPVDVSPPAEPVDVPPPAEPVDVASPAASVDVSPHAHAALDIVSAVLDEDPFDDSLNLNLSESLVELQMDTLSLDCSICSCSFEYLMDLIDHKNSAHTEPVQSIEPEPVPSTSREPPQVDMSQTQDWIDEAMLSIPASQNTSSKNNPSAYARFIKMRRPVLKKKYPDCTDIMKKLV